MAGPAYTYDLTTPVGQVRLLLNDIPDGSPATAVFTDVEVSAFLTLARGSSVKRAAALAIDANATNEALASKVLRTQDVQTDGAKLAAAMREHADRLRGEADADDEDGDGFFFGVVDFGGGSCRTERTAYPYS